MQRTARLRTGTYAESAFHYAGPCHSLSNGGMECQGSQECKGICKASPDAKIRAKASGACQADTHDIYGCYNEVKVGMGVTGICFD